VIEGPFTGPPGTPMRLEGREAIREYSRRVMASPLQLEEFEPRPESASTTDLS
jgi:hypothetical protein